MKQTALLAAGILAVTAGGLALRLGRLNDRPMHTDEAVHAVKFEQFLQGTYRYDPWDCHGPTLYYFAAPVMWLTGAENFAATTEATYRVVPVLFGAAAMLLLLGLADGLGRPVTLVAAVGAAISPAMVFYSRYYIQETLLVTMTFGLLLAGWRYARSRRLGWALLGGACMGLMHATKETCVLAFAAMAVALGLVALWARLGTPTTAPSGCGVKLWHLLAAAGVAAVVSVAAFSQGGAHWGSVVDSVGTYVTAWNRGRGGEGVHNHRWNYYLTMLTWWRQGTGPVWTEGLIVALAAVGFVLAMLGRGVGSAHVGLLRFIAFYTLALTAVYSALPYKTPWCMLSFLHGMTLLAGVGAVGLLRLVPWPQLKIALALALLAGAGHLGFQAWRGSYALDSDPRNPYVYGHSLPGAVEMARRAERVAAAYAEKPGPLVQAIATGSDYWPLPWYLRRLDADRIGYWPEVPQTPDAAVVIVSSDLVAEVGARLRGKYTLLPPFEVRPSVMMRMYERKPIEFAARSPGGVVRFRIAGGDVETARAAAERVRRWLAGLDARAAGGAGVADGVAQRLREEGVRAAEIIIEPDVVYGLGSLPGEDGWPVALRDPAEKAKTLGTVLLRDAALGRAIRGDGRGGHLAAWAIAPTAAEARSLAETFRTVPVEQVTQYCAEHEGISAVLLGDRQGRRQVYSVVRPEARGE